MDESLHVDTAQFEYIARISHGKDSLKMLDVIITRGLPLDRITTTDVWATDTIRADFPEMVEFKERADEYIWRKYRIEEGLCGLHCKYENILGPSYDTGCRDGCWFCHNQGVAQLRLLRKKHPDLWALLLKWDTDSPVNFKTDGHTVHDFDRRFQMEDDGWLLPDDRTFRWAMLDDDVQMKFF